MQHATLRRVILAFLILCVSSQSQGNEQHPSYRDHPTYGQALAHEQTSNTVIGIHPADGENRQNSAQQQEDDTPPENFYWDTLAQWIMAVTSGVMAFTSAVAIILVYKTLKATRDTVSEAQRSADAAERAVEETRRVGEAQVRAYVSIPEMWFCIDYAKSVFIVRPTFQNTGHSPTKQIAVYVDFTLKQVQVIGQGQDMVNPYGQRVEHTIPDLVPGTPFPTDIKAQLPEFSDVVFHDNFPRQIQIKTKVIFIDVFDKKRAESFNHLAIASPENDLSEWIKVLPVPPFLRKTQDNGNGNDS